MQTNWDDAAEQQTLGPQRSSARLVGLFLVLGIVIAAVLIFRSISPPRSPTAEPAVGLRMTKLQLEPLTGEGEALTSESLAGQVTLINFWGPWCPPCRLEFPELMELRSGLAKNERFRFVSVSCMYDANESELATQTTAYLTGEGYDLPVHRDPTLATRLELMQLNRNENLSYPTTVLLDQQGIVRAVWIGYKPGIAVEMRRQIDELLQATTPDPLTPDS